MLHALRRSRAITWLVVVTLASVTWLVASPLYHGESDDRDCAPIVTLHDHSAHRVGAASDGDQSDPAHCFICHWHSLRSLRTALFLTAPTLAESLMAREPAAGGTPPVLLPSSSRAPPLV
jgi:hypothetical protein